MADDRWSCLVTVALAPLLGRLPPHLVESIRETGATMAVGPGCELTPGSGGSVTSSRQAELRWALLPVKGGPPADFLEVAGGDTLFVLKADNQLEAALANPLEAASCLRTAYNAYLVEGAPQLEDDVFVAYVCYLIKQGLLEQ